VVVDVDAGLDLLELERSGDASVLALLAARTCGPNKEAMATTPSVPRIISRRS
jgi:hypothetical protein